MNQFLAHYYYALVIILLMLGLWAMISKRNYMKKVIGMIIFQTAIIFFFIAAGAKMGASIPILEHAEGAHHVARIPQNYHNPLPHVLMLTAIVVGVATLGVALALLERIYDKYGSIEEHTVVEKLK